MILGSHTLIRNHLRFSSVALTTVLFYVCTIWMAICIHFYRTRSQGLVVVDVVAAPVSFTWSTHRHSRSHCVLIGIYFIAHRSGRSSQHTFCNRSNTRVVGRRNQIVVLFAAELLHTAAPHHRPIGRSKNVFFVLCCSPPLSLLQARLILLF